MSEDEEFQRIVNEGLIPKLTESAVCVNLAPDNGGVDAKFCVELGAMILLDKPIITIVEPGRVLARKLDLVSDVVICADPKTEEGRVAINAAIEEYLKTVDE